MEDILNAHAPSNRTTCPLVVNPPLRLRYPSLEAGWFATLVEGRDSFYEVARVAYRLRPELSTEAAREQVYGLFRAWPLRSGRRAGIGHTLLLGGLMRVGASDAEIAQATGWKRQYINKVRRDLIEPLLTNPSYAQNLDDAGVYAVEGEEAIAILRERRPDLRGPREFVVAAEPGPAGYREALSPALRVELDATDAGRELTGDELEVRNAGVSALYELCSFIREHRERPTMPEYVNRLLTDGALGQEEFVVGRRAA